MLKAGIVLNKWKREIFERHLDADGFQYSVEDGPIKDTWIVIVYVESAAQLEPTVTRAEDEAQKSRRSK